MLPSGVYKKPFVEATGQVTSIKRMSKYADFDPGQVDSNHWRIWNATKLDGVAARLLYITDRWRYVTVVFNHQKMALVESRPIVPTDGVVSVRAGVALGAEVHVEAVVARVARVRVRRVRRVVRAQQQRRQPRLAQRAQRTQRQQPALRQQRRACAHTTHTTHRISGS